MKRIFLMRCVCFAFIMVVFCWQIAIAGVAPQVKTEKDTYDQGEMIRVYFSNSTGNDGDWICIVPAGSPDTEGGDYKYMPRGLGKGSLIFDPRSPGKYEVRAYYNYSRNGYVVSARYAFSVVSSPEGEAAMAKRTERKLDPSNPLEAGVPTEKGLVYIFRGPFFIASHINVPIKADGKQIVVITDSKYFLYPASAGDVVFTVGNPIDRHGQEGINEEIKYHDNEIRIKIKPGYVYYIQLTMIPMPSWDGLLYHVPHQEGANIIESYKLTQLMR